MPKEVFDKDYPYLPHADLLSFEEITRVARQFVAHGVRKIRLTGGEPLLRKNIEILIEQLAALRTVDGEPLDITLTTNGSLLARKAKALKDAGLQRVTVSLDGLDDAVFRRMNDVDFPVAEVLEGIDAAREAGPGPDQGQHGGQARHQRARDPADGAPLQGHGHRAALHRIHGRRRHQRLAHGRSAAVGRGGEADPRRDAAGAARALRARRNRRALGLCRRLRARSA